MSGPLTIRFATDVEPARKGIASLRSDVVSNLNSMNAAFTQGGAAADAYGATLGSLSSGIDTVLTGLAVLDAAKGIIGRVGEALNDAQGRLERTLAIAQGSRDLGVGTGLFQVLTLQAKELGVETTTLTGLLAKARDAATVKLGVGNDAKNESAIGKILREDVQVGNITQADANSVTSQSTQEGRIKAILDLMDKLRAAGKVLAAEDIGRNFFGDDFITKLRNGVDLAGALRKALADAKVVGGVSIADDAAVARASEMKAKVEEINNKYATGLKPLLDDIAYLQDRASSASLDWSNRVADLVVQFGKAYEYVRGLAIEAVNFVAAFPQNIGDFAKGLAVKAGRAIGVVSGETQGPPAPDDSSAPAVPITVRVRNRPKADTSVPRPGAARRGGSDSEDPDAVEQLIRAIGRARDVQEAELTAVGKTVVEREKLLALARGEAAARDDFEKGRRTSATLDDDEKRRILERAEALGKAKAATQDLEQAQRQGAETARYFGQTLSDGLSDAIIDGKSLTDVVGDIAKALAKAVIQAELLGTGPLAALLGTAPLASAGPNATGGLLGSLLGAFGLGSPGAPTGDLSESEGLGSSFQFRDGGFTGSGGTDEPAGIVHRGEYVVPKVAVARLGVPMLNALARGAPGFAAGGFVGGPTASPVMNRMAGQPVINVAGTTINAPNADAAGLARLRAYVDAKDAQLPVRIRDIQRRAG